MIRATLAGGASFTGPDLETAIITTFGPTAFFRRAMDPNRADLGEVLMPSDYPDQAAHIVGRVMYIDQEEGKVS